LEVEVLEESGELNVKDISEAIRKIPSVYFGEEFYTRLVASGLIKWYRQRVRKERQKRKFMEVFDKTVGELGGVVTFPNQNCADSLIINPRVMETLFGDSF